MKLESIAEIYMGIVPSRKKELDEIGKVNKYKLFSMNCYIENNEFDFFYTAENLEKYLVHEGDLIFKIAYPYRVIYVDKKISNTLITNQFCIIRTNYKKANPKYIKWFLETKETEIQLEKTSIGTVVKTVKIAGLRDIQIPYLNLKVQNEIGNICELWNNQKSMYEDLIMKKEKIYNQYIKNTIDFRRK